METIDLKKYLPQKALSSVNNLEFLAKQIVEGFVTGLHKSPFHGFSAEFSQHKPYSPGDNIRYMDWKVYARSDRYYIKQFEEETNLRCTLLLDISKSMTYSSGSISKLQFAEIFTACLAYLMLKQRDATGLMLFDDEIRQNLTPKSVPVYIKDIIYSLNSITPGIDTNITNALHNIADSIKKRGLIILISDLLDNPENVISGIKHLKYNQHEIVVFHIVDEEETNFNFKGEFVFEDLETGQKIKTDSRFVRKEYIKLFQQHCELYKTKLTENHVDYVLLNTSTPIETALSRYLMRRENLF